MDVLLMDCGLGGESKLSGYEGQIELLSFSHGVALQATSDVSDTARTSGKAMHQNFSITKYIDKASPELNVYCCKGDPLPKAVTVTVGRNDKGSVLPFMIYTMEDVLVTSVSANGGGGDKPTESVTLGYNKITWNYKIQEGAGGGGSNATKGWDLAANKEA